MLPGVWLADAEGSHVIEIDRDLKLGARPDVEANPCVRLAFASQDEHDGPVRATEHSIEGLFVGHAWSRTVSRMGMNPNAAELFRLVTGIDLSIEKVCDRFIVEGHMRPGTDLFDKLHVLDEQQVVS